MALKPVIAIPLGDPNGIGPEIALRAANDPAVRAACVPKLVGDAATLGFYGGRLGLNGEDAGFAASPFAADGLSAAPPAPGEVSAAAGRATIAYARAAIGLARAGVADAVVAAPHNETAVAAAGIAFSGYPGLLAAETATDPDQVFLMLVGPEHRIVHLTLHMGLRAALDLITPARVTDAARAAHKACRRLGIEAPHIGVCGLNPHAGEGGLFGDDDDRVVMPGVEMARAEGIRIDDPAGADVLLAARGHDAYLAMYHDQGHIPIKLTGRGNSFGVSIGTDVLFATVAHGSAHDIAGQGVADAQPFINTVLQMARELAGAAQPRERLARAE